MKGLIFIPDISGFTNFVQSCPQETGALIISDLLNVLIDNKHPDMQISEIEGDAILLYQFGEPVPLNTLLNIKDKMTAEFNSLFRCLKFKYGIMADLTIKFIAHYGEILLYDIKGFQKLYGETVIESHCLLKNGSNEKSYLLITEDYINAVNELQSRKSTILKRLVASKWQLLNGFKKVAYYFINTNSKTAGKRVQSPVTVASPDFNN